MIGPVLMHIQMKFYYRKYMLKKNSDGPTYDKIGLCSSRLSKFDKSTFLWIDSLMVQPTTKSASALPDCQNVI